MSQSVNSNINSDKTYGINTIKGTTAEMLATTPNQAHVFFNTDNEKYYSYNQTLNRWELIGRPDVQGVPLGSILTAGATYFINGGAGVYISFDGASDDAIFFNCPLIDYDGGDLQLELSGRISSNGAVGNTVGLILDYALVKDGDNTTTTVTNVPQQNVDVSAELQDIQFSVDLAVMNGVADANTLLVTITRNSAGGGSDTYPGSFELTAIRIKPA